MNTLYNSLGSKFKKKLNCLLLISFLLLPHFLEAQSIENIQINHGPYLQNTSETKISIVFSTNKLAVPGVILYDENNSTSIIQNSHDGLIDVGTGIHKVHLTNLKPGTAYKYRTFAVQIEKYRPYECTFGDTVFSSLNKFTTFSPNINEVNFTVFCDIHDDAQKLGKYLEYNSIENQDLYFLNGDIMGYIHDDKQVYVSFLDTCISSFAQNIPFFYARGNHETRGAFARHLKDYLVLENDNYYYAFSHGKVRFIVLDGGEDKPDNNEAYSGLADFDFYRAQQLQWLKQEVASEQFKRAEMKIVVIHMPIIENKNNWYGMAELAKNYGPVLNDAGIDLMISGHKHKNEWINTGKSGFDYPVIICSNKHFLESKVKAHGIELEIKDQEGKTVIEKSLKTK